MIRVKAILAVSLLMALLGCKNAPKQQQINAKEKEVVGINNLQEMQEIYYRFPSPDEMLDFIRGENLNFNDHILLPVASEDKYLDSRSQALNLGVYISDMAYIILFKRQKEALAYFQVVYDAT
jgi:hypothetical protein